MNKTAIASLIFIPIVLIMGIFYFGSELVSGKVINVETIAFTQTETLILDPGDVRDLECSVTPEDAKDKTVSFTSSDDAVVSVDTAGHIEALSYGTAIITVTTTDGGLSSSVTVIVSERLVTGVQALKESLTLKIGENELLEYTLSPLGSLNKTVTWTSSDETVASIDANGKVVAVSKGTATITLTTSTDTNTGIAYTDTITVNVLKDVESIVFVKESIVSISNDINLEANNGVVLSPSDVSTELSEYTYNVDKDIATITDGVLTFTEAGTVIVTVTSSSNDTLTDTITVQYTAGYPTGVTLDKTSLYIDAYSDVKTGTITASITPITGIVAPKDVITWTSSNESVATVDSTGVVTGVAVGTTTITATTADGKYMESTSVTVGTSYVAVQEVYVDIEDEDFDLGYIRSVIASVEGVGLETPSFTGVIWTINEDANSFKFYEGNNGVKGAEIAVADLDQYRGTIIYVESVDGGRISLTASTEDASSTASDTGTITTTILPDTLSFNTTDIVGFDKEVQLEYSISSTLGTIYPFSNSDVTMTITDGADIAFIDAFGKVTFSTCGTITVLIESDFVTGLNNSITVTYAKYEISTPAENIESGASYTLISEGKIGDTFDFGGNYSLSVPEGSAYTATDIVTTSVIDGNLTLTGINHGTVIVTVDAANGVFLNDDRTFTINVNEGPASIYWPLQSNTLDIFHVGTHGTVPLVYTLAGLAEDDIFDDSVELVFTSMTNPLLTSDEIATIANGEITFLQATDATLTITSTNNPSVSATFMFTVNEGYNVDTEQEINDALTIGDQSINLVGNVFVAGENRDVFMATKAFSFLGNDYTIDASGVAIKEDNSNAQGVFALTLEGMTSEDVVNFQDLTVIANTGYELGYRDMGTADKADDMYDGSRSLDTVQVTVTDGSRLGTLTVTDSDFSGGWVNVYIRKVDNAIFTNVDLTNAYCDSLYAEGNASIRLIDSTLGQAGYSAIDMATAVSLIANPDGILGNDDDIVQTLSVEGTTTLTNWIPASAEDSVFMRGEADYTMIYSMISGYITGVTPDVVDTSTGSPMIGLSITIFSKHPSDTGGVIDYEMCHNFSTVSTELSDNYNESVIPVYNIVAGSWGVESAISLGFEPNSPTYIYSEKIRTAE
jgi:uncharacterized protein YjdB